MEKTPRSTYGIIKIHNLYSIFRPLPLPRVSVTLLYFTKGIKADTPLAKYHYTAIFNTLIQKKSTYRPRTNVKGVIPRAIPSLGG